MTSALDTRWSKLTERIKSPGAQADAAFLRELDALHLDLQEELFGGRPVVDDRYEIPPDDRRLAILVDTLGALSLLEPDDPSFPQDLGLILTVVGRPIEAAHAYLEAASRFDAEAKTGAGLTGDEADWAASARAHAARQLTLGGQPAAAAALLPALEPDDHAEIAALVEQSLRRVERAAG